MVLYSQELQASLSHYESQVLELEHCYGRLTAAERTPTLDSTFSLLQEKWDHLQTLTHLYTQRYAGGHPSPPSSPLPTPIPTLSPCPPSTPPLACYRRSGTIYRRSRTSIHRGTPVVTPHPILTPPHPHPHPLPTPTLDSTFSLLQEKWDHLQTLTHLYTQRYAGGHPSPPSSPPAHTLLTLSPCPPSTPHPHPFSPSPLIIPSPVLTCPHLSSPVLTSPHLSSPVLTCPHLSSPVLTPSTPPSSQLDSLSTFSKPSLILFFLFLRLILDG